MTFNSIPFLMFLPIVLGLYYVLPHRWQNWMLLIASYVFYGWWSWKFLILLLISTTVDYLCGITMARIPDQRKRLRVLLISLSVNLGFLGFFKYYNFFIQSAETVFATAGLAFAAPALKIVLPVGISFYTFQSMSYAIDVYRGHMQPIRRFTDFSLYVTFFPQLVAGPIERATSLLPQLIQPRVVTPQSIYSGMWLILLGFVKKIAIADAVAVYVRESFGRAQAGDAGGLELIGAVYLFAIQIYCDFSGYTDIARGIGRMMGVELMVNFRRPYLSSNITDFWRRWHISLSTFLRDYLYIPLGGNRNGASQTYRNLMITMLLGGLWHGANWTFVIWGALHGILLSVHRLIRGNTPPVSSAPLSMVIFPAQFLKVFFTFQLVCLGWIFFRAENVEQAFSIIGKIAALDGTADWTNLWRFAAFGGMIFALDMIQESTRSDEPFPTLLPAPASGLVAAAFVVILFAFGGAGDAFIYFQF